MPAFFPRLEVRVPIILLAGVLAAAPSCRAETAKGPGTLTIEHIDLKPTKDGYYDATVGFLISDPELGKTGRVAFNIVVGDVHDADEAITKVHEPVKALGQALQRAYSDIHREP